jgi:hypothetical protein
MLCHYSVLFYTQQQQFPSLPVGQLPPLGKPAFKHQLLQYGNNRQHAWMQIDPAAPVYM